MLDKVFGAAGRGVALKKMAADQLAFAPVFLGSLLSILEMTRNGWNVDKTKAFLRSTYGDVLKTNYMIWPAVQTLNFAFVPIDLRLLVVQGERPCCSLVCTSVVLTRRPY